MSRLGRGVVRTSWAVGCVGLLLAVDLLVGLLVAGPQGSDGPGGRFDLLDLAAGQGDRTSHAEEFADVPAMQDLPWADAYWDEYDTMRFRPVPYAEAALSDRNGRFIVVQDGIRRSYEPADLREDAIEVWFLGGSTTWGQGQRDEHTIPSQVARLAEEDGVALRVVNLGVLGHTAWQGLHRLVAELGQRPAPDVVVSYDGANELAVQIEQHPNPVEPGPGQPTLFDADQRTPSAAWLEGAEVRPVTPWDQWWEVSLLGKLVRRTVGGDPAGAAESITTPEVWDRTSEVYVRARTLTAAVAEEAGSQALFFAQPVRHLDLTPFLERIGPPTIDVSDALDEVQPDAVYLDSVHTNELGAHLVAEQLWRHLRPALAADG